MLLATEVDLLEKPPRNRSSLCLGQTKHAGIAGLLHGADGDSIGLCFSANTSLDRYKLPHHESSNSQVYVGSIDRIRDAGMLSLGLSSHYVMLASESSGNKSKSGIAEAAATCQSKGIEM